MDKQFKSNQLFFVAVFVLTFFLNGLMFSGSVHAEDEYLFSIHGSNTVGAKLGPELAVRFLQSKGVKNVGVYPGNAENESRITGYLPEQEKLVSIYVAAHGSSSGFKALSKGVGDIAAASRRIKKKEKIKLQKLGDFSSSESEFVIGIDGLAVIVHPLNPLNPIKNLEMDQIAKLFSGEIRNWKELGGEDRIVNIFARDNQSGTWDTFKNLVLAKKYTLSSEAHRFESNAELSGEVLKNEGGIGFVSLNTIGGAKPLMVSDASGKALAPKLINVSTEDYVLSRRLYMYLPENSENADAREFVEFAVSDQGQNAVTHVGYVSQHIALRDSDQSAMPMTYQNMIHSFDRASVNFRFDQGKAKLDNKAKMDIQRLVRFINEGSRKVRLIGFSETNDDSSFSKLLSKLRADVVKRQLIRNGVSRKKIEILGYEPKIDRQLEVTVSRLIRDRRVEVWVQEEGAVRYSADTPESTMVAQQ